MDRVAMIPAKTELSIDGVPEFVPYKHITYADHHVLVREYRALAAELKDKSQHVVDLEAQLKRVTDDYLKYAEYHWVSANERPK